MSLKLLINNFIIWKYNDGLECYVIGKRTITLFQVGVGSIESWLEGFDVSIFVLSINRFLKSIFNVDGAIVIDDEVK